MNTDQAFDLLKDAGLTESSSIQIVRRWLSEGRIKYEGGNVNREKGFTVADTDLAFDLLKDAGIPENNRINTVRRWLVEGRIKYDVQNVGNYGSVIDEKPSKLPINELPDQNKDVIIHRLKLKIQAQDTHLKGMEELHETSKKKLIQQREMYKKEVVMLRNENSKLQNEAKDLLTENIELRNELMKVKQNQTDRNHSVPTARSDDYSKKLGLSKKATVKEVLAGYKGLLKITHPDHNGNAKVFHYIKTDYDNFRNGNNG
ncbi:hypothetical protein GW626_11190 [Peribacillus muralis]|uniref:hypothetical protein n=1 Tax=Peribacillus muralis TaxID=264697 RepID=UPI001F4D3970|nr:hypothetical protein [Peribacillus muralis]MCK1993372.1 hypothetical protein [Peribacillus muralis]MCK2014340.1 hypothetical protein [Peribacillus muralis]